jgi:uncharacterized protein YaaQ
MRLMKLVISVINSDDTYALTDALVQVGFDATIISTTGGFLREGNTTLLIGVEEARIPHVLRIIRETCRTRTKYVTPYAPMVECEEGYMPLPIEVQVGGAVVFIVDVERFEKF